MKQVTTNLFMVLKQKFMLYKDKRRAFSIGQRAALGKNIYLTFGSDKTVVVDAQDSYKRYAMAMKHYNQSLCDKGSFLQGFNKINGEKNARKTR